MDKAVSVLDWETLDSRREFWNFSVRTIETSFGIFTRNLDWDTHNGTGNTYYFMDQGDGKFLRIGNYDGSYGEIRQNKVPGEFGRLDEWDAVYTWKLI